MKDYMHGMGLRIKEQRKKLRLTQEETAEKLEISVKHFSEVERGLTGLSIDNLIKLSNLFGISIDYIVKGDADRNKWDCVMSVLGNVPAEKEQLIKELIITGARLANDEQK